MHQTPAHNAVNHDLLGLMPKHARAVVEVGCMQGALAAEYRQLNPAARYTGIDIDPDYAQVAAEFCDRAIASDVERMAPEAFAELFPSDCWVFGDCLEHLRDPWEVLRKIRKNIDPDGCLVTCIPNAQHWSVQMRLASGLFRYEDSGLLDRTHIRWFTRVTMLEMFAETGWAVDTGICRYVPQAMPTLIEQGIRSVAQGCGADADQAIEDAKVFQFLFRLRPA